MGCVALRVMLQYSPVTTTTDAGDYIGGGGYRFPTHMHMPVQYTRTPGICVPLMIFPSAYISVSLSPSASRGGCSCRLVFGVSYPQACISLPVQLGCVPCPNHSVRVSWPTYCGESAARVLDALACVQVRRDSETGLKLLRLAALSTRPVIISSSMRVISSMFLPAFEGVGGKKDEPVGLMGDVGPLACRMLMLLPSLRW